MGICSMEDTLNKRKRIFKYIIWINLIVGLLNLYYYVNYDTTYSLILGSLNIWVWVANRNR